MKLLDTKNFGDRIYERFPDKYKEDDIGQNFALKRYLQSCGEGFKYAIEDINGLVDFINPDTVDEKYLPIVFKSYGLEIFNGIPQEYLRSLLPRLSECYSMKGSFQVVDYVCSTLSGIKTDTKVIEDIEGNILLQVSLEVEHNLGNYMPDIAQLNRVLVNFIPFYCSMVIVLSYVYSDTQDFAMTENTFLEIFDTKVEEGALSKDIFETMLEKVRLTEEDIASIQMLGVDYSLMNGEDLKEEDLPFINGLDTEHLALKLQFMLDEIKMSMEDVLIDKIKSIENEEGGLIEGTFESNELDKVLTSTRRVLWSPTTLPSNVIILNGITSLPDYEDRIIPVP